MLTRLVRAGHSFELHHGDCKGVDEQTHHIAKALKQRIVIHPGVGRNGKSTTRAFCQGANVVLSSMGYIQRDQQIVDETDILIGVPLPGKVRSGTWTTINYARGGIKPVYIIYGDGTLSAERGKR